MWKDLIPWCPAPSWPGALCAEPAADLMSYPAVQATGASNNVRLVISYHFTDLPPKSYQWLVIDNDLVMITAPLKMIVFFSSDPDHHMQAWNNFCFFSHIVSGISSGFLPEISSDISSDMISDIFSDVSFDSLSDPSSGVLSDILIRLQTILSGILCASNKPSGVLSGKIVWDFLGNFWELSR